MTPQKPKVGIYGISGCAGCLLSFLFEDCFKQLIEIIDIKAFPMIKQDNYKDNFDYVFIEGTVCFDDDILILNELRKRTKHIVALGSCACQGGVPSIKNFINSEKTIKFIYPKYDHLKSTPPTPIDNHIKVDYYLPQCPPNKEEIIEFIKCIATNREFKSFSELVCFECRKKSIPCLLEKGEICLGPVTNGGCSALCPSNKTMCYGCRGPSCDANYKEFLEILQRAGYTKENMIDKMKTFCGLQFSKEINEEVKT